METEVKPTKLTDGPAVSFPQLEKEESDTNLKKNASPSSKANNTNIQSSLHDQNAGNKKINTTTSKGTSGKPPPIIIYGQNQFTT